MIYGFENFAQTLMTSSLILSSRLMQTDDTTFQLRQVIHKTHTHKTNIAQAKASRRVSKFTVNFTALLHQTKIDRSCEASIIHILCRY